MQSTRTAAHTGVSLLSGRPQVWPSNLASCPAAAKEFDAQGDQRFAGLRVRTGFATGACETAVDPVTGRPNYRGAVVRKAVLLGLRAPGGSIFLGSCAHAALGPALDKFLVKPQGFIRLWAGHPLGRVYSVQPEALKCVCVRDVLGQSWSDECTRGRYPGFWALGFPSHSEEGLMGPWVAPPGKPGSGAPHSPAAMQSAGGAHAS